MLNGWTLNCKNWSRLRQMNLKPWPNESESWWELPGELKLWEGLKNDWSRVGPKEVENFGHKEKIEPWNATKTKPMHAKTLSNQTLWSFNQYHKKYEKKIEIFFTWQNLFHRLCFSYVTSQFKKFQKKLNRGHLKLPNVNLQLRRWRFTAWRLVLF